MLSQVLAFTALLLMLYVFSFLNCAGGVLIVLRGGTTVYIHGAELQSVSEAKLVVIMKHSTVDGSTDTVTETNFTSHVRELYNLSTYSYTTHS